MGARFSAPIQTGPGAYPASCTMGTGSFPGIKRPGRGADHPPHLSAEVKKEYGYTSTHLWTFMACMGAPPSNVLCKCLWINSEPEGYTVPNQYVLWHILI